jgi:hypothetical protein
MGFSASKHLEGLKDFQKDTVEYVFSRFFGTDPTDRFLVADEVGLGKTMIARGVIAKLIEHHLKEDGRRIDVVYICSNQAIARQNFSKLAIVGRDRQPITDRITTLPIHIRGLGEPLDGFDRGVNIIPITPTTSLDLRSGPGRGDERAVLWHMLSHPRLLGRGEMVRKNGEAKSGPLRLLTLPIRIEKNFKWERERIDPEGIDPVLWDRFADTVSRDDSTLDETLELVRAFRRPGRERDGHWAIRRQKLVARLRYLLAESCVAALEPDLVILDEFQRFPQLLDPESPAGFLADRLFRFEGCKSLLLSATPYRMFTRSHELDESHHDDFITTTSFLMDGEHNPERVERLRQDMQEYRQALVRIPEDGTDPVHEAKEAVQSELGRVMCRTERLGVSSDRDGMLDSRPTEAIESKLESGDLVSYKELDSVARDLGTRDVLEFWKSTPYPLNLMRGYVLIERFEEESRSGVRRDLRRVLDLNAVRRYGEVDPSHPRLRGLLNDLDARGAWKQLWLPPSLPYYSSGAPFDDANMTTKRLIFSQWTAVPRAVAMLTSYHVERQIFEPRNGRSPISYANGGTKAGHLSWSREKSMQEALYVLPASRLGEVTDPLAISRSLGRSGEPPQLSEVVAEAKRRILAEVEQLNLPSAKGEPRHEWYAVAILRMEERARPGSVGRWLTSDAVGEEETHGIWSDHVRRLTEYLTVDPDGPVPDDLVEVLSLVGLGGPGVCTLRALNRVLGGNSKSDDQLSARQRAAIRIGNAMRLMYDQPDSTTLIDLEIDCRKRWQAALYYGVNGNLQAILDEYIHVLSEWVGSNSEEEGGRLGAIRDTALEALGIRAVTLRAREIENGRVVDSDAVSMRTRFALRLSDGKSEDSKTITRIDSIRKAFNSPFWPFVLVTTSIGQEGLDFHLYCHAVVHWNLPHNPVDLEQREGRVHRFKNHAVRRNLASDRASVGMKDAGRDPWEAMFTDAKTQNGDRRRGGGVYPEWVYIPEGDGTAARIERHVPVEPLSADQEKLDELVRLLGIYRLAFGQPRQDEFLAALQPEGPGPDAAAELSIDLSPPPRI